MNRFNRSCTSRVQNSRFVRSDKKSSRQEKIFKGLLATVVLCGITTGIYFTKFAQGADFTFIQSAWNGGTSTTVANHAEDQSGWTKYDSATNISTATAGQISLAVPSVNNTFSETFTSENYKDTAQTTATWNTSSGSVESALGVDGAVDLYAKLNGTWGNQSISASVFVGDFLYIAGAAKFGKYNPTTGILTDLSSGLTGASFPTYGIRTMVYDNAHDMIYFAGDKSLWRYSVTNSTFTDFSSLISGYLGSNVIYGMNFDSNNNAVYIGSWGKLIRYNASDNTTTDLTSKISGFMSSVSIDAITFDSTHSIMFFGGSTGKFAKYDVSTDTATNLTTNIAALWSTNAVDAMVYDNVNQDIYLVGANRRFGKYSIASNVFTSLDTKVSSIFAATTEITEILIDAANGNMYLSAGSVFVQYNYIAATNAINRTSSISSFFVNAITVMAIDNINNKLFLAGAQFAQYDVNATTAINLTLKKYGWYNAIIYDMVLVDGVIYFAGGFNINTYPPRFAKYTIATGQLDDLTDKLNFWSASTWTESMAYDATNGLIYIGGTGQLARYNIATGVMTNLTSKMSSIFATTAYHVYGLEVDGSTGDVYFAGTSGKFAKYSYSTDQVTNLTTNISGTWSTSDINDIVFDTGNHKIYLGGASGKFAQYDPVSNVITNLTSQIASFWSTNAVNKLLYDDEHASVYLGGVGGKFAKYTTAGTITDLTSKISSFWSTLSIKSLAYNGADDVVYLGGTSGAPRFAKYTIGVDAGTDLTAKITSFWGTSTSYPINAIMHDANENVMYLGGGYGKLATYSPSIVYSAQSTTVDTITNDITAATLTKNDTPGSGTITYFLSNDGGVHWQQATPGSSLTFSQSGSDLRFKIILNNGASVQSVSIDYASNSNLANGELISSIYDTTVTTANVAKLEWSESIPANTNIKFQIRTSPDAGNTWSAWCGPDDLIIGSCNSSTYFTNSLGEDIDDIHRDRIGDRYMQYKAFLTTTDGVSNPVLHDVTLSYGTMSAATVTTSDATMVRQTSAIGRGTINDTGGSDPERFIEWGTQSGDYTNQCTAGVGSLGAYTCNISGLAMDTTYYVRAKATNSIGTTHGQEYTIKTMPEYIVIVDPNAPKMTNAVSSSYINLADGTVLATSQVSTYTGIILRTNDVDVRIPPSTVITRTDDSVFDFSNFTAQDVTNLVQQSFVESLAAVKIGVNDARMTFSQPITLTVNVGALHNGQTMNILYQNDDETEWHPHTTCTVTNGVCEFTTTHATTYTINGNGSVSGAGQNDITTDVQDVLSLDCDQTGNTNDNIVEFGNLTPGTPVTGSTTCTVTTNSDAGYILAVKREDAISTMDKDSDTATDITDRTTWNNTSPNATTWQTNDIGLAFTVYNTTATKNTTWWGTGTIVTDANNKYAGFPTSYTDIMQHTQYNEAATATQIGYKLDVPTTQKSGIYSGDITYQVVTAP